MKKIILFALISYTCIFAKNANDTFCEDIGIMLVQELNNCAMYQNDTVGVAYNCANGQFFIDREAELYVVYVSRDTVEFRMYFLPKKLVCAIEDYDELRIKIKSGKTKMSHQHRFDVYNEFKKRFVNMQD